MSLALEGCVFKDGILQPRESFQVRAAAINLLPTSKGEFPQLSTQALQIAQHNVNAICPGLLSTPLFEHLIQRPDYVENESLRSLTGRA